MGTAHQNRTSCGGQCPPYRNSLPCGARELGGVCGGLRLIYEFFFLGLVHDLGHLAAVDEIVAHTDRSDQHRDEAVRERTTNP